MAVGFRSNNTEFNHFDSEDAAYARRLVFLLFVAVDDSANK